MRYYELKEDKNLRNHITIAGFEGCPNVVLDQDVAKNFKRGTIMYVEGTVESQYPDLFQAPTIMISEKMYQILKYYDTKVIFRVVYLTDLKQNRQEIYRLMVPPIKEEVFTLTDKERIFLVKEGNVHRLIVTRDVLESILSRDSIGVIYREVKIERAEGAEDGREECCIKYA